MPTAKKDAKPSWFGFVISLTDDAPFTRTELTEYLERQNVQTRNLFAGNILRHPCFDEMRQTNEGYRVVGELCNTDTIMERTFWVGVYPGMTEEKLAYMVKVIKEFLKQHRDGE